jgi:hypothetical protein
MATMQDQNYLSAVSDTVVLPNAGKHIGSGCFSAQMTTGRKCIDAISAPIGGVNGKEGYYPVIFPSQIVPSLTQIFGGICASLLRPIQITISPGRRSKFTRRICTHRR